MTQAQWNFNGFSLQNDLSIGGDTVNAMHFWTAQQRRMSLYQDGHVFVAAPVGTSYLGLSGSFSTTMHVNGGEGAALAAYAVHPANWRQCLQSYVNRQYSVSYVMNWNGNDRFFVAGQGWLFANGAWFGSDANLKTNVTTITNALAKVLGLRGVTYQWKSEELSVDAVTNTVVESDTNTYVGLIAQEVEPVVPEVVRTLNDGRKGVAYQNLVALLIEAMKEQQALIQEQQRAIEEIRSLIQPSNSIALLLRLPSPAPAEWQVEASPDLQNWTNLGSTTLTNGSARFDAGPATESKKFFRAKTE